MPTCKLLLSMEEILRLRRAGATYKAIGEAAGVGPMRISQLIHQAIPEEERERRLHRPFSKSRREFTGTDLDIHVKSALRRHCEASGISISSFVATAVEDKLKRLGVTIVAPPVNVGERLPFEEASNG